MNNELRAKLEELRFSKDMIEVIQNTKDITLNLSEKDIIRVEISKDVAYDLYCDDYLANDKYREVGVLDIVYSEVDSDCFKKAYRYAEIHEKRVKTDIYDSEAIAHQTALVCYILVKVNEFKYKKLKTIDDVKEAIPFQVYRSLINDTDEAIDVYVEEDGVRFAGDLNYIEIHEGMFGTTIYACLKIVSRGSEGYILGEKRVQIEPKPFVKDIEDLGLKVVTDEMKQELTEIGKKYVAVTKEPKYCECHGEAYSQGMMSDIRHRIDSRVMIDVDSMRLLNPRVSNRWYTGGIFRDNELIGKDVPEDMLWMCSPVVFGFSFGNKIWCRMYLKDLNEIVFSDNAFDELIIPQENKDVFVASLTHDMPSLDSISDKGAGKIFLLYGAPGVGKTMTAESVAEFLQKPLYFVSVGELGVRPEQLEEALERVMKVASSWDAVILLDEVDVFAVKREGASIERNAMTAIFLRMLERYSGIMFMTTNLLNNLDDAFVSRATAVIKYNDLTATDRAKIWNGLLDKVEALNTIEVSDDLRTSVAELSQHSLNGRIIKNTVRLAYSLAVSKNEKLSKKHIDTAMKLRQC